jgi:hypothetical protein
MPEADRGVPPPGIIDCRLSDIYAQQIFRADPHVHQQSAATPDPAANIKHLHSFYRARDAP